MDHTQCDSSDNEAKSHFIIMNNQKLGTGHFSHESAFSLSLISSLPQTFAIYFGAVHIIKTVAGFVTAAHRHSKGNK